VRKVEIIEKNFAEDVTHRLCEAIRERDLERPFHLFLSGGSTPKVVYAALAEKDLNWDNVHLWWGDERFVPPDHADSNYRMVKEQLLDKLELRVNQVHPWPILSTPELSAETYQREFSAYFLSKDHSLDIQLLGMGEDGHTASLFPETEALSDNENYCNANYVPKFDTTRLTLTYPALALSRRVIFLVKGESKAEALREVLEEGLHPAAKVFGRESTEFWLDPAAAKHLS
jgi:6-phosphogluconolactonase